MERSDVEFMRRALELARRGLGRTSPNPMVGAVLVKDGRVIGEGWHREAGAPHAEVEAIAAASEPVEGATLYVNLEPCSHFGRTPPCTDAILSSRIKRVVCAMEDPNPLVSGRGIETLRRNGVEVEVGLLRGEAEKLNEVFVKYITTGYPFVTLKLAQTLDGRIAAPDGSSKWISSEASRMLVQRMRSESDAVLVGINTVIVDNPRLNVRTGGRSPVKIVLDSRLRIPTSSRVFSDGNLVVVTTDQASPERIEIVKGRGADVWIVPSSDGRTDIRSVLREAAKRELSSVLIEGGSEVAASALRAKAVDRIVFFIAPKIMGDGVGSVGDMGIRDVSGCIGLRDVEVEVIGDDLLYKARPAYAGSEPSS